MLAEMLTGTFKAYGAPMDMAYQALLWVLKLVQVLMVLKLTNNITYLITPQRRLINGFTPKYTMSIWMGFSEIKEGGVNSFLGHSEQEYPQYLYEDVMSDITSSDDGDFKKPDSVNGLLIIYQ